jgi:hypothetical protein
MLPDGGDGVVVAATEVFDDKGVVTRLTVGAACL